MQASGKLRSLATGVDRSFQTDSRGAYSFTGLAYGRYRLEVSAAGFATQSVSVDVPSAAPVSRTVTMTLAASAFQTEVVGTTPLAGVDLAREEIAAPVQTANARDVQASGALDLSDFLNRRLSGVHVNEVQGNPFQPDVNYRGYTASPLLGTPQGLSVYMDGVRLNQPFGDVVSWDLIPRIAVAETTLMPGSNPLFGLNTLGGALSLQTKDGRSQPGFSLALSGGSFGRKTAELEYGGSSAKGLSWYMAANLFFEDGWRESSPSDVRQFFGKLGWQHASTSLGLTVAYANNSLTGNGVQEQRFLARDYASVYTKPDVTANRSPSLNLSARHSAGNTVSLSANAYYREIRTNTLNGDVNQDSLDQSVYQPNAADRAALTAAGYTGFPVSGATAANTPFPFWRCIAKVLQRTTPDETCDGLLNRSHTEQHNYGASGQFTWFGSPFGQHNQFTAGAAWDGNSVDFQQSTQLGYLNPDRSVTGVPAFGDGVTGGTVDGVPFDTRVDLHGQIRTGSIYATDTLSVGKAWHFTLSGRYNRTSLVNRDRITPGGGPGSLDSSNVFGRFNPAAGITYSPSPAWNAYVSYSEGSRAPTSIELGCADPVSPCRLPNAMAGDPPLDQVVARTFEAGVRGNAERRVQWSAGWFRADNRHDILFVASNQTGFGYFKNFGKTRRQGVEVDVSSRIHRVSLGGGYTLLDATYQSPETVDGSSNSVNDAAAAGVKGLDGTIAIQPGMRIPLVPRQMLKAFADLQPTKKLSIDLGMVAVSSAYARGNENNLHQGDGLYYLGPGTSPGYAVLNGGARYQVHRRLELFAQVNNLLDRRYYTAAQLGTTAFSAGGTFLARPFPAVGADFPLQHATFYAPGAPRGAWGGIRIKF
jgi:outer membrane receptor protein involved in Fe transport